MAKSSKKPGPKKPTGRPPKPAGQVRALTLRIRLTEAEHQAIGLAAEGEALETSSWARAVLLREARRLQGGSDK